jgi:hypothetical protein
MSEEIQIPQQEIQSPKENVNPVNILTDLRSQLNAAKTLEDFTVKGRPVRTQGDVDMLEEHFAHASGKVEYSPISQRGGKQDEHEYAFMDVYIPYSQGPYRDNPHAFMTHLVEAYPNLVVHIGEGRVQIREPGPLQRLISRLKK